MNKVKIRLILTMIICLTTVYVVEIIAKSPSEKTGISIRKIDKQVVLYTIYRGNYNKIGLAIGNLYALAGKNQISPRGALYYVYLNNPNHISSQHWLTETRIPVSKDALKAMGTLGEMTDVKALPAIDVAVAVKPKGQADPGNIYNRLDTWILKHNYIPTDSPREVFLTNAMAGDYTQMETEIMLPIRKPSLDKD